MTTRERREEYSSANVIRVLNPSRQIETHHNGVVEFDSNLDNLLEDLQASVSRPGSSLGQPITNYSREVQYMQPANVTSVVRERSLSPGMTTTTTSNERKMYKTAKYEYKTSSSGGRSDGAVSEVYQRNINQLDTLLNDLERERDTSVDRNRSLTNVGIDSGLIEPGTKVVKTTTTYTTAGGKHPVARELTFESPNSHEVRRSRSRNRSPSYENASTTVKNVTYSSDTGLYGGIRSNTPQRTVSPIINEEYYTETISPDHTVAPRNVHYNEHVKVDTTDASSALQNISISGDILPKPNTKVTTTVRTYTYELPPDHDINQKLMYTNETINQTSNTLPLVTYPERDTLPSQHVNPGNKTIIMKNETFNTTNNVHEYPVPTVINHQLPPNTAKTVYYKRDTKQSTTNFYPSHPNGHPGPNYPAHEAIEPPPGGVAVYPAEPPMKYTNSPQPHPYPSNTTYVFKQESNTTNNKYGSPMRYPDYPKEPLQPNAPTTVTYKYSSTTTNASRNIYPPPEEREPLLQPFPTDGIAPDQIDGNPPKRLDDLMATFGDNGPITYNENQHPVHEKHISKRSTEPQVKPPVELPKIAPTTKNIAGPPVYYPPGHEMFAKKEEEAGGAAWRAQGQYSKASGKYMYESESKSKSSSKSGAAVVPVCLPLCCAMPCTIM